MSDPPPPVDPAENPARISLRPSEALRRVVDPSAPAPEPEAKRGGEEPFVHAPGVEALVEVTDVRKTYVHEDKPLEVLRGVSLRIERGEVVAIVGRSGAGKSTLLHLMGTLDLPSSGTVRIDGQDVNKLASAKLAALRNATVGFVFQFHHLLPEFTAVENVMMPGLIQGKVSRSQLETRAKKLLDDVKLGHRLKHRPSELSGGEQQRVALARALVLEPKLLLADEPTGNLDSTNSTQMHELFFELNRTLGTTMVIVTHNEGLARKAPRIVRMEDGKVIEDVRTGGPSGPFRGPGDGETTRSPEG